MTNKDYVSGTRDRLEGLGVNWSPASNKVALAASLGDALLTNLAESLDSQGSASLVVSGGSTPAPVFDYMSKSDIDWANVTITLADERWVPLDSPDSNEALVRNTLMTNNASSASFVSLYLSNTNQNDACGIVSESLKEMPHPFTAVVLGMGNDGHTASLFPDAPESELVSAMDLQNPVTVAMMNPPSVGQSRITLTRVALLNSKHRYLHITGEGKCEVLYSALQGMTAPHYQPGDAPVTGLIVEKPELMSVFWSP